MRSLVGNATLFVVYSARWNFRISYRCASLLNVARISWKIISTWIKQIVGVCRTSPNSDVSMLLILLWLHCDYSGEDPWPLKTIGPTPANFLIHQQAGHKSQLKTVIETFGYLTGPSVNFFWHPLLVRFYRRISEVAFGYSETLSCGKSFNID